MPAALKGYRVPVVTLDEGKEFALHGQVAEETGIGSCFALPPPSMAARDQREPLPGLPLRHSGKAGGLGAPRGHPEGLFRSFTCRSA